MKKRTLSVFVFLAMFSLLSLCLAACQSGKSSQLTICFDMGSQTDLTEGASFQQQAAQGFAEAVRAAAQLQGRDLGEIQLEVIPSSQENSAEREAMLQRIRTEIMTGEGPDVFLCRTEDEGFQVAGNRLFPYLPKSMEDGIFLPLDEYLEKSQLVTSEELVLPVFEGGRDSQGHQMVAPLCYSIPCLVWEQSAVNPETYGDTSWDEVFSTEDPFLREQVRWVWPITTFPQDATRRDNHGSGLAFIYPDLLNLQEKKLGITQEELCDVLWESLSLLREVESQPADNPSWALYFSRFLGMEQFLTPEIKPETTDLAILPLRNVQGGTSAVVSLYCGINANTQRPEDAAFVVEYLLSQEGQKSSLFESLNGFGMASLFVNKQARGDGDTPLTAATKQSWENACEQVTQVHYPSPADQELYHLLQAIQQEMQPQDGSTARPDQFFQGEISQQRLQELVSEYWEKIARLLEEA